MKIVLSIENFKGKFYEKFVGIGFYNNKMVDEILFFGKNGKNLGLVYKCQQEFFIYMNSFVYMIVQ